jgi:hypothetical protein
MGHTPQGGAIEGNVADDALMVDQGNCRKWAWQEPADGFLL